MVPTVLEAAARGDAARLASLLRAQPALKDALDERPRSIYPPYASLESSINNSIDTTNEKNRDETYIPSTDDDDGNSSLSFNNNRSSDLNESVLSNYNTNINDILSNTGDNAPLISGNVSLPSPTSVTETPQHTLLADSLATCSPPLLDVASNVTLEDHDVNESLPSTLIEQIISSDAFNSPPNIYASETDTSFIEDSGVMESSHAYNVCILPSDEDSNLTIKDQVRPCSLNGVPNGTGSSCIENSQILQSCVPARNDVCVPTGDSVKSNLMMDNRGSNKLHELTTVPIEEEKITRRSPTFTPPILSNSSPTHNDSDADSESIGYSDRDETYNPEFEKSSSSSDEEMTEDMLLHAELQTLKEPQNGCSALQRAAADGHVDVVQLLLQHGADPNKQDLVHGNTAIHEAAWKGYSRCVSALAAGGADLRASNAGGFAPLHLACQNGHNQSTRELLLAGAPPDLQNNYGDTALHTAARYGHAGATRILLSAQCRVAAQNKNGDTALHIAAAMARRKLTRILLEAGCDKTLKNHQGETARDIATRKGLEEIIAILNTPVAKQKKKEKRDKSKERVIDEPDAPKKPKDGKKKKNVHFETPATVQWSPYGCHYYPDPKYFPKPKLSSLPTEPLRKGEQYFLDLAGNIKKGPIGAGYTCYCAPFFKHMEEKMNEDKKDLKKHIDRAHERLDQKVTDLEMKTQGQISELTRFVAAERALCKERHQHLEHWLTRGVMFRASERVRKLDYSPRGSLDIPPMKRTRSLEILDHTEEWNKVNRLIKSFNQTAEHYESHPKERPDKQTSKSTEVLDTRSPPTPRRKYILKNSMSSDQLDAGPSRMSRSPHTVSGPSPDQSCLQNVTAEIHVKANKISVSQSPVSMEVQGYNERFVSPSRQSNTKSPSSSREYKASDSEDQRMRDSQSPAAPAWKSQVLQRTADDIRKRVMLEKEMSQVVIRNNTKSLDISQDGYVKLHKQPSNYQVREDSSVEREPRKSVQELVAQVEQQRCQSPDQIRKPTEELLPSVSPNPGILKMPQQPLRPAPVLKEKPPKSKRFSLHNLIPFPTRKTFQTPPKDNGNNSESSDEEDNPIRTTNQPGPMKNTNLLQTLPLPNYETMSTKSQSPAPQVLTQSKPYPPDFRADRMIPKDAYFHEIPNRPNHQLPYREMIENGLPTPQYPPQQYDYNQTGLPQTQVQPRNRNPLYHHQTGVFDAMMQDHIMREMERIPHCYSEQLDQNTEVEIANQNEFGYYDNRPPYPNYSARKPVPDHNLLHSRLQSLAINTHLTETQSQTDRESHNDSGYSTKVYGSSQGPSPSLSGHVDGSDNLSGQRVNIVPNGKPVLPIGASSLV